MQRWLEPSAYLQNEIGNKHFAQKHLDAPLPPVRYPTEKSSAITALQASI